MIESRAITDRAEWLRWRPIDVTASVVGAVFGVHPYKTALRLYAEKRGTEFVESSSDFLEGREDLEPAVVRRVKRQRPHWTLTEARTYYRDPDLRLGATPDYFIHDDPRGLGVLEVKTAEPAIYYRDWIDGDEPPLWIILQAVTQAMLADAAFTAIAIMRIDARNLETKIHEIARNPEAEDKIKTAVAGFWKMVAEGKEPEPDFGRDLDVIKAMRPRETAGKIADLSGNNELPGMLERRAAISQRIKEDEAAVDAINAELMFLLGDAEAATGLNGWRITYKTQHRSAYTVPAKDLRVLRVYDKREKP